MLNQILKILTPELIVQAVKDNPQVIIETLHKFDTFKLLGASLTNEQQLVLSNNTNLVNSYLGTAASKTGIERWSQGFVEFVSALTPKVVEEPIPEVPLVDDKEQMRIQMRAELEAEIRKEYLEANPAARIAAETEARVKALNEITAKNIKELEAKTKLLTK